MKQRFFLVLLIVVGMVICAGIIDATTHEWHPLSGIKWGVWLEEIEQEAEPTKPYVKERLTWRSDRVDEDAVIWTWGTRGNSITATILDSVPDANVWVELEWCSRHGEVRAVRVE